jgi:NodT family efflux transporter outer membrane factor (OMF) lipoprotein
MPEPPNGVKLNLPSQFSEATRADVAQSKQITDLEDDVLWWRVLGDPVLDQLQNQLAKYNPNLISLAASVDQAKAAVALAQSNLWPTLNANTGLTKSQSYLTAPTGSYISESFPLSWTPDIWGALDAQIISALAQQRYNEENLKMARLTAQATLIQTYLTMRNVEREQRVLIDTEQAYAKALEITQSRYQSGVAVSTDVSQARLQLANAKSQRIDLGIQRAQLLHAIAALVGTTAADLTLEESAKIPTPLALPQVLPGELLKRRPDIRAAMRNVESAQANLGAAKLAFFPSLTFSSNLGYRSTQLPGLLRSSNAYWSIGPSLSLPILDGGERQANKSAAQAALDSAVANYRQVVLSACQEVEDNLVAASLLEQESHVLEEALDAARKNKIVTDQQYLSGTVGYLNVTVAQASELQAQRALMDVDNRRWLAITQLLKNMAGLWQDNQIQPEALRSYENQ